MERRYARFEGSEFGIAPTEEWPGLRRELLEFEHMFAHHQGAVGLAGDYPYDPGVKPGTRVFQRPTPLAPDRREWVKGEMERLEASGVIKRVRHCECAVGVVLIDNGQ